MTDALPAISVMFATIRGCPDARLPVDATRDQLRKLGGELVVVDGRGQPAPAADEIGDHVRWISRPGESVFQLRLAGYDDVLSIEHEDRRFEGSVELVQRGFLIARNTLRPLIVVMAGADEFDPYKD